MRGVCPRCNHGLVSSIIEESASPRFRACPSCSYPLDFEKMWKRVEEGPGTDAAVGSLFGPGLRTLTYEAALRNLRRQFRFGVNAFAEYENAILFRVMDEIFIFNFGPPGDCSRYWDSGDETARPV